MKRRILAASSLLVATGLGSFTALADTDLQRSLQLQAPVVSGADEFGPAASDAEGAALMAQLEAKWGNVMRKVKGWGDGAMLQFREGYKNYPVALLQEALAAPTFEGMQATLDAYTGLKARTKMAKAFPMNATTPEDANNVQLIEARNMAAKTLGENAKDLVFIPITPCTVWDTRFATDPASAGAISNGTTKLFYSFWNGAGTNFSTWGGNPSCTEANQAMLGGGSPFAAMMIVYVNNPTGNGWLTFYRAGDPDPSQATISVYYSPGPTRTQTVISKSNRGYGTAPDYDIAVTSRFATADASASVVGYFIKPQATALDCTNVAASGTAAVSSDSALALPACAAGYTRTGGYCYGAAFVPSGYQLDTGPNFCYFRNTSAVSTYSTNAISTCCRVPGR